MPRGLRNLGNTCYFNSVLQPLCQTHTLCEELGKTYNDGHELSDSFFRLSLDFQNEDGGPDDPFEVRNHLTKRVPRFNNNRQHDSHECLRHLLDEFRKEERATNGSSEGKVSLTAVDKIFGGHLITVYICEECEKHYHLFEPCLDISLPVFFETEEENAEATIEETSSSQKQFRNHDDNKNNNFKKSSAGHNSKTTSVDKKEKSENYTSDDYEIIYLREEDNDIERSETENSHKDVDCDNTNEAPEIVSELPCQGSQKINKNEEQIVDKTEIDYRQVIKTMTRRLSFPPSAPSTDISTTHSDNTQPSRFSFPKIMDRLTPHFKKAISLDVCLTHFSREEKLHKEYLCQDCLGEAMKRGEASEDNLKFTSATKQTLIFNPPAILTIHFKRFELLPGRSKKRSDMVKYPEHLDLAPYCSSQCLRNEPPRNNIWYSLYAVVVHSGSLNSGHYVAYVKVRESSKSKQNLEKFLQRDHFNHNVTVNELINMITMTNEQVKTDMYTSEKDGKSHDKDGKSHEKDVNSHDKDAKSHEKDVNSHDKDGKSHEKDVNSHDKDGKSHEKDVNSHDKDGKSHEKDVNSHDKGGKSHEKDVNSHDKDGKSHEKDVNSLDKDGKSHKKDVNSHDKDGKSHEKDVNSHDKDMNSPEKDVNSHEKKPKSPEKDESKWYLFNDSFVREVKIEEVLEQEAYLLFYERIDNEESEIGKNRGEVKGLRNIGNSCYFNSVIQPLCHTYPFYEELWKAEQGGELPHSFYEVCHDMRNGASAPFVAKNIRDQFMEKVPRFNNNGQHDSHECLRHLLDEFRKEERATNASSGGKGSLTAVDKIFGGHLITVFICKECDKHYHLFEPCLDISVPVSFETETKVSVKKIDKGQHEHHTEYRNNYKLDERHEYFYKNLIKNLTTRLSFSSKNSPKKSSSVSKSKNIPDVFSELAQKFNKSISLDDCLTHFSREEQLDKEYLCKDCLGEDTKRGEASEDKLKLTSATKQTLIFNPPAILTIHFKRFKLLLGRSWKRSDMVKYPEHLDLAPYCSSQCLRNEPPRNNIWYSLYAVVVHSGSLNSGHYVAYVKVREREENIEKLSKFLQQKYFNQNVTSEELINIVNVKKEQEKTDVKLSEGDKSKWYLVNIDSVHEVSIESVLEQEASLLFYERVDDTVACSKETPGNATVSSFKPRPEAFINLYREPTPFDFYYLY